MLPETLSSLPPDHSVMGLVWIHPFRKDTSSVGRRAGQLQLLSCEQFLPHPPRPRCLSSACQCLQGAQSSFGLCGEATLLPPHQLSASAASHHLRLCCVSTVCSHHCQRVEPRLFPTAISPEVCRSQIPITKGRKLHLPEPIVAT